MHQGLPIDVDQVVTWRTAVAAGLRVAWRQRRLVLLVWFAFFLLAAFAAVPTWRACDVALSHTPESERLLDGLNIALVREMATSDGPATTVTLPWMIAASALMALLWNPFVSGGMLTVLLGAAAPGGAAQADDAPPAPHAGPAVQAAIAGSVRERFFAGGARHYWRLFGLLGTMLVIGLFVVGLAGVVLFGIQSSIDDRGWERTSLALTGAILALLGALAGLLAIVTDYARIAIVRDGRRLWPGIWTGVRLLFRRPLGVVAFGLTFVLLLALLAVLYVQASDALPFRSWSAILLGIVFQQLFSLTRTGLRVAMVAGELPMLPPPALVPAPMPEPDVLDSTPPHHIPAFPAGPDTDLNDLPPLA
jgi:hypothetical protein